MTGSRSDHPVILAGDLGMADPEAMTDDQLMAIRSRVDEPPPLVALAGRKRGRTPLVARSRRKSADTIGRSLTELEEEDQWTRKSTT
ncbi:MAG: hypothetical protein M3Z84_07950 [Actinomycetota bacterium]|nr:hypothetical protein [Actinomycetota bacterium]